MPVVDLYEQSVGSRARKSLKGRIDLAGRAGLENRDFHCQCAGGFLHGSQSDVDGNASAWIDQDSESRCLGHQFVQESKLLRCDLEAKEISTGGVATGSRETRD